MFVSIASDPRGISHLACLIEHSKTVTSYEKSALTRSTFAIHRRVFYFDGSIFRKVRHLKEPIVGRYCQDDSPFSGVEAERLRWGVLASELRDVQDADVGVVVDVVLSHGLVPNIVKHIPVKGICWPLSLKLEDNYVS